jgi:hypothetical protein
VRVRWSLPGPPIRAAKITSKSVLAPAALRAYSSELRPRSLSARSHAVPNIRQKITTFLWFNHQLVECDSQQEVDTLWARLTEGGTEAPCGWLKDRYGLAWQIAPKRLLELVTHPDRKVASAAARAMFQMKKIVIADIERAVKEL